MTHKRNVQKSELDAHNADTSVHGISNTASLYAAGGTDVAVADGGTGASTAPAARSNLGAGARGLAEPLFRAGYWNTFPVGAANSTSFANTTVFLVPFDAPETVTIDRVAFDVVTVGSAGSVVRVGLWADDGTNRGPGAFVADFGTVATDSGTGVKTITVSQQLTAGRHWFAIVPQGGSSVTLRYCTMLWPLPWASTQPTVLSGACIPNVSTTFSGALSGTLTLNAAGAGAVPPRMAVRVASIP